MFVIELFEEYGNGPSSDVLPEIYWPSIDSVRSVDCVSVPLIQCNAIDENAIFYQCVPEKSVEGRVLKFNPWIVFVREDCVVGNH